MIKLIVACSFLFCWKFSYTLASDVIAPFHFDGCTLFFNGKNNQWKKCCFKHDLHYWLGGPKRLMDEADNNLKSCIENVSGYIVANIFYSGVRFGHLSPIKTKYKWGWSREDRRFDIPTSKEIELLPSLLLHCPYKDLCLEFINHWQTFQK